MNMKLKLLYKRKILKVLDTVMEMISIFWPNKKIWQIVANFYDSPYYSRIIFQPGYNSGHIGNPFSPIVGIPYPLSSNVAKN